MRKMIVKNKIILLIIIISLIFMGTSLLNKNPGWVYYKTYIKYLKKKSQNVIEKFYYKADTSEKIIAITFDDGPMNNTSKIIKYLKKENIPATFFLVMSGLNNNNIELYSFPLIELGIHTYKHDNYTKLSKEEKRIDIEKCLEVINKIHTDKKFTYFRPAYGIIDYDIVDILEDNDLQGVLLSIDSQDWNGLRGQKIVDHIVNNIGPGSIILFHDRLPVDNLENIINAIKEKGFQIVQLKKILQYKSQFPEEYIRNKK